MPTTNTPSRYGSVAKSFHWLTALLVLSLIPFGQYATYLAHQIADGASDPALVARTTFLFSMHKTVGLAVFFVALLRILWALSQPKPGLLNGHHKAEAWAAETVHWLLYGSLVIVPLSGWVHHAATTGFAPIWWPFGQSLPFVPKDAQVAQWATVVHYLFQWVLTGAVALHIAGALKHHVFDQDATLRRMLPGQGEAQPSQEQPGHVLPFVTALIIWGAVLLGAAGMGWFSKPHQEVAQETSSTSEVVQDTAGNWAVQSGNLSITVVQMGSDITGQFADWTADISYDETPDADGVYGQVTVDVRIPSLTLGSVTDQATGNAYLDAAAHPNAVFTADLFEDAGQKMARGTLTIKDQSVPVELPFTLEITDDTAVASGQMQVNRLDFNIGEPGEGSVAFAVQIGFALEATRRD
ncbi:MAG: cytochrome b/b6 domain-containing protein [Roseovarius sp.]